MTSTTSKPFIAIACGGTGGHLFPGLAVAEELLCRECEVMLLISPKEVDQEAVKAVVGMQIETLPAVALSGKNVLKFGLGFWNSFLTSRRLFKKRKPQIVLAMGGFTSAPPIFAARNLGAKTFIHESNSVPGRANRWLSRFVDSGFIYFSNAKERMRLPKCVVTGMPVRSQFLELVDPMAARMAVGLNPKNPVLLVMGGSQGASGVNKLVISALPLLSKATPELQFLHLTGQIDFEKVQKTYKELGCKAVVRPFFTEMELALGAATVAVSRSGASSLAEIASLRVPSVLVPYPTAADNHQYHNAMAFVDGGAALISEQSKVSPDQFATQILTLLGNEEQRARMQQALSKWHFPNAAQLISDQILSAIGIESRATRGNIEAPVSLEIRKPNLAGTTNVFARLGTLSDKSKEANG
jgi:UDP-N-acetylglucosamine--N-acetylmuramyl-(pentapeptide) pyrophosphoryl-undecaprenol N-acetylglucosamine transferase